MKCLALRRLLRLREGPADARSTQKRPYHPGDLRPALLLAVREMIAEHGIESLSLRECARRAGLSWSAPGHHFGDKTGRLTAFAIECFAALTAHMEKRRDATATLLEAAAAVGAGYLEFALKVPEYFRVMFRAELLNERDAAYQVASSKAFGVLESSIRACQPAQRIVSFRQACERLQKPITRANNSTASTSPEPPGPRAHASATPPDTQTSSPRSTRKYESGS